jgi:hypothetical protein
VIIRLRHRELWESKGWIAYNYAQAGVIRKDSKSVRRRP